MFRWIVIIFIGLVLAFAAYVLTAWMFQERLMFWPYKDRVEPRSIGLDDFREIEMVMADGTRILAWQHIPDDPDAPYIVYFHGNGGNLASRASKFNSFAKQGWGVIAISYRSYGGSDGKPNEPNLISDGFEVYDRVLGWGTKPENIVLYGESMGTGIAVQLAAQRDVGAVILEAPYSSTVDVAESHYKLPARYLMRNRFMSTDHIADIDAPLLWMHGTGDIVIPIRLGQKLYGLAPDDKRKWIVQGGGHSDLYNFGAFEQVQSFVDEKI